MIDKLPRPSKAPCGTCPYRKDVPSGVWAPEEYEKLKLYDGETFEQIMKGGIGLFYCHQNDGALCAGWVACHDAKHLAAYRFQEVDPVCFAYKSPVPVFESGHAAAEHGLRDIDNPGPDATLAQHKLLAKQPDRVKLRGQD